MVEICKMQSIVILRRQKVPRHPGQCVIVRISYLAIFNKQRNFIICKFSYHFLLLYRFRLYYNCISFHFLACSFCFNSTLLWGVFTIMAFGGDQSDLQITINVSELETWRSQIQVTEVACRLCKLISFLPTFLL